MASPFERNGPATIYSYTYTLEKFHVSQRFRNFNRYIKYDYNSFYLLAEIISQGNGENQANSVIAHLRLYFLCINFYNVLWKRISIAVNSTNTAIEVY